MRTRTYVAAATLASLLTSCSGAADNTNAASPRKMPANVRILPPGSGDFFAVVGGPGGLAYSDATVPSRIDSADRAIAAECALAEPPRTEERSPALLAAAATAVIGWIANYVVSQISSSLQKAIAEYSALDAGSVHFGQLEQRGAFYAHIPTTPVRSPAVSEVDPWLGWNCALFQRFEAAKDAAGKEVKVLASEAIIRFRVADGRDSLVVQPLRLYFGNAAAKYDDQPADRTVANFGVSLSATFDATWQTSMTTGEGKTAQVFSTTILKQPIDIANKERPRFFYYSIRPPMANKQDTRSMPQQVSLVPWSASTPPGGAGGTGVLTVTLAEVSTVPRILDFIAGIFKSNNSDISKFLASAAEAALGISDK